MPLMDPTSHTSNYSNALGIECSQDVLSRKLLSGLCTVNYGILKKKFLEYRDHTSVYLVLNYILGTEGHLINQCPDENGIVVSK